jgi:hypothetical protein
MRCVLRSAFPPSGTLFPISAFTIRIACVLRKIGHLRFLRRKVKEPGKQPMPG